MQCTLSEPAVSGLTACPPDTQHQTLRFNNIVQSLDQIASDAHGNDPIKSCPETNGATQHKYIDVWFHMCALKMSRSRVEQTLISMPSV